MAEDKDELKEVKSEEQSSDNHKEDDYEKVCYVCRRPESKAGKMITMPGNICICNSCMQRAFDQVEKGGFPGMMSFNMPPGMMNMPFKMEDMPNMVPQKQKVKKKKEAVEPVFDIHSIPAPHKINAQLNEYVVGQDYAKKGDFRSCV